MATEVGHQESAGTARSSAVVAGWTLVSRGTGLLRVLALGTCLGPTFLANGVQIALVVPNLVYTVIAGSVVAMVVIPAVTRAGEDRAVAVLGRITGSLLLAATGLAAALAVVSPLVARALAIGDGTERAHQLLVLLVLLVAPQIVGYVLAALGVAAQQARGRFALAAAAPAVENLAVIASILIATAVFGPVQGFATVPVGFIVTLGLGSTAAVALHAAIQLTGAARAGLRVRPRLGDDPEAKAAVTRMRGSVGVAAFPAAGLAVTLVVAGTVAGGVLVVQVSQQVFATLSYLGPRAVSMAAMPVLSGISGRADATGYAATWRSTVFYTLTAALPSMVLLAMFARPAAGLLTWRETGLLSQFAGCLTIVAIAQLIGGLHDIGRQALFARLENQIPVRASACALIVVLGVCGIALLVDGAHRLVVLTGSLLLSELTAGAIVLVRLRTAIRPEPLADRRHLGVLLAGAGALVLVAIAGLGALSVVDPGRAGTLGMLAVIGVIAVAAYAATMRFAGRLR